MELRHLRYYTAVVEAKGFREASRRLHVAQPALTQTVHDLESELGFKLLERGSRSFATTQPGEVFYHEAKRTLQQADQAVLAATRAASGVVDAISIGFIPGATEHFLPELLRSFKARHPHVRLDLRELTPAVQLEALLRGELDLGLTSSKLRLRRAYCSGYHLLRCFLLRVRLRMARSRSSRWRTSISCCWIAKSHRRSLMPLSTSASRLALHRGSAATLILQSPCSHWSRREKACRLFPCGQVHSSSLACSAFACCRTRHERSL